MDGMILANSLVSLKGIDLRMVYVLLQKTNIGNLISSKAKDFLSKDDIDHFTKHLEEEVKKIENVKDEILQVDLFLEMTKQLKLRGTKYTLPEELEDQCTNIINGVYALFQEQDKQFKAFTENQSNVSKLQQIINFQMKKIFSEFDHQFNNLTEEDQVTFVSKIHEYIQSLPQEKQEKIKEKLGINDLTHDVIRKVITTSGTSILFAVIVEISGFAFYSTATSLVASFATIFGHTLPFGFYTGLTSFIAVLANPLFIIPFLLGGGFWYFNQKNKTLKKKFLPMVIMQITLPYMSGAFEPVSFQAFIDEWESRYNEYSRIRQEYDKIARKKLELIADKNLLEKGMAKLDLEIANQSERVEEIKERVSSALKSIDLDSLEISEEFSRHKAAYERLKEKINDLKVEKEKQGEKTGLLDKIRKTLTNFSLSMEIREEERKLKVIWNKMIEAILHSSSHFKRKEREKVNEIIENIKLLKEKKNVKMSQWNDIKMELAKLENLLDHYYIQIENIEKKNYGLKDVLVRTPEFL